MKTFLSLEWTHLRHTFTAIAFTAWYFCCQLKKYKKKLQKVNDFNKLTLDDDA